MINDKKIIEKENVDVSSVPLLDLKAQYATIRQEIEPVVKEVIETQYFILGPKVQELEKKIAAYSQCEHAVGVRRVQTHY